MKIASVSTGSKYFFLVFFVLMSLSICAAYYKYIVIEDYEIHLAEDEVDLERNNTSYESY